MSMFNVSSQECASDLDPIQAYLLRVLAILERAPSLQTDEELGPYIGSLNEHKFTIYSD